MVTVLNNTNMENLKGIIFDYGGTIDTNSRHWAEVLWEKYQEAGVPVTKEQFREAYVHGERTLAKFPLIKPYYKFIQVLQSKITVETEFLVHKEYWNVSDAERREFTDKIAGLCNDYVLNVLDTTKAVVAEMADKYPVVLVSNFYGNINAILDDFGLEPYFKAVIESAIVGVRKPDPKIYALGVEALGLKPEEVLVVGDSFSKDIVPAKSIGCKTAWLKGEGWGNEEIDESVPDIIITDLEQLSSKL